MLIDTHAHVNFSAYKDDADEVIRRCLDKRVWMINVGSQYSTSKRAVEIAQNCKKGVYAAVGLHPIHADLGDFEPAKYKELAKNNKVVAIGEIGLDYKPEYVSFKTKQEIVLRQQMDLAQGLNLPIIFHCRLAHDNLIDILKDREGAPLHSQRQTHSLPEARSGALLRGVVHCFTGDWGQAKKYLEMGFYLGLNGIIFKLSLDDIIKKAPLERILVETDCPYLTPPPMEGRNEPLYVKYIIEKIAQLKNLTYEEIADITTKNAEELFRI
ncbi:MAG: TatD family hydrolase [Patescibacteria group bacterium]